MAGRECPGELKGIEQMRELALFSGGLGGVLGTHLLGWRPVGYVEWNKYCQRITRQRMLDGILPEAPIFGDIDAFLDDGYAAAYSGLVDVVTAGFPCQPYSIAGKRRADADERNKWPQTLDVLRAVGPQFALLENVPDLVSTDYFGQILGELAEAGFDAEWGVVPAAAVGATHRRDRLWIAAIHSDAGRQRCQKRDFPAVSANETPGAAWDNNQLRAGQWSRTVWSVCEPAMVGMADDVAHRLDRIRATGNGQVPGVVVAAWQLLSRRSDEWLKP
jgi:DNA (cytosine-5)-methyltransferase 1